MKNTLLLLTFLCFCWSSTAQKAYFVDGFHGGIWGHYPEGYTAYMVSLLETHPDWRLNLEIEPETWDRAREIDHENYTKLKTYLQDTSNTGRVEYVNPTYGQAYLYNISGESIIRQFSYGRELLEDHFPEVNFYTYASEEPCFTSALPQILNSFGIQYASLKNPNTCWGGYVRAHGGELVNWIGSDGTSIPTVPRYQFEALSSNSTWETIGNGLAEEYVASAFNNDVAHPLGMCLQDAGWKWGPWLKEGVYQPNEYTTWRNYFENVVDYKKATPWKLNQEDILVSLVWGSQVLQRLAQQIRFSENHMLQAEKMGVLQGLENGIKYPKRNLDDAWKKLLLAQHHDCWIVPYNEDKGTNWAEKVTDWTTFANTISKEIITKEDQPLGQYIKVYNTTGTARADYAEVSLPENMQTKNIRVVDADGKEVPSQLDNSDSSPKVIFKANVPGFGYRFYQLEEKRSKSKGSIVKLLPNGEYSLESDLYHIIIDPKKGGRIKSLVAKKLGDKEFVDTSSMKNFNLLQGNFYDQGGMHTNGEQIATIKILANGPVMAKVAVTSYILDIPVTTTITLAQGEPRIDMHLFIDWKDNVGIGAYKETKYDNANPKKAFYNDEFKLLALFPLALENQKVYKNAPFDVMQSGLDNTFFDSWNTIKNNIVLDWVDVTDGEEKYGCALFSDHTTSYAHGETFPLALTVQYSGVGLWGRDYSIDGPTEMNYALIPHQNNWEKAQLWQENQRIKEPLLAVHQTKKLTNNNTSFLQFEKKGWVLSSVKEEDDMVYVRIFNAEGDANKGTLHLGFDVDKVEEIQLNDKVIKALDVKSTAKTKAVDIAIPQFGFKTLRLFKTSS